MANIQDKLSKAHEQEHNPQTRNNKLLYTH